MNRTLVAKMSWEIVSNVDKVWVKVFQKKYVKNKNFMKVLMLKFASWSWQSIFGCRDVLKNGLCHRIGAWVQMGNTQLNRLMLHWGSQTQPTIPTCKTKTGRIFGNWNLMPSSKTSFGKWFGTSYLLVQSSIIGLFSPLLIVFCATM